MTNILIKKKGGYLEDFDISKINRSLVNAGCSLSEAEKIGKEIKEWVEKQPRKIIHSFEIEKQLIDHTQGKHKDVVISFLVHAKNKISPIKRAFGRNDIAQMLTSLFVIIQVFVLETIKIPFLQTVQVLIASFLTCMAILWLVEGKQMWKHLTSGFILVSLLASLIGVILGASIADVIIAISVGLPVAAMIDVLRS